MMGFIYQIVELPKSGGMMLYVFGACELDTSLYALRRGGQLIRLRPKVFQVLTYLLTHRDRVVSRDELCEQVWPEQHISDTALETTLRDVRRVIGDSGRAQGMIQTLHGHGYRFVATVEMHEQALPVETQDTLPVTQRIEAESHAEVLSSAGEHKLVTMLCCALVHTPEQRQRLGLESLYNRMRTLYDLVQREVQRYAGTLQPVMGECVLAMFGVPVSQEDHAQRAVLAALELRQRLHHLCASQAVSLEDALVAHIGVHTGEVVAGGMGKNQEAATEMVGSTATLTTALQQHAAPGTILCSHTTARLVRGVVRVRGVQPIHVAGQSTPVTVYRVVGRVRQRSSVGQQAGRPLNPFVGRAAEMATLHTLLTQVQQGRGQVVGIVGEPGIGKSRLVYEFYRSVNREQLTYLAGGCLSYAQTTPYLPWLALVRQACGLMSAKRPEAITAKVKKRLQEVGMRPEAWVPYLLHFLEVPGRPDLHKTLSPQAIKARMFETLVQLCLHISYQRPVVLEVENLHWLDETSEEGFTTLAERLSGVPILLVTTYRPGYRPPWMDKSYMTQLVLQRLTPEDSRRVVQGMLRGVQVTAELVREIQFKADGNPFFLEELARDAMEHGGVLSMPAIPDTVQAVLSARIDRLKPGDKRLLQKAAVIGKDVPLPLLQAIAAVSEEALHSGLRRLQASEFLYEARPTSERIYTFKHALTQEVAYASLLTSARQQEHRQIVDVLEARYLETLTQQPELLAQHCTAAGLIEPALHYWQQAGRRARERSAHAEAIAHLTKGLEVLETQQPTPERNQHELDMLTALGSALMAAKGYAATEVGATYTRAYELCHQVGETPRLIGALLGLEAFYFVRGEFQTAHRLGKRCLELTQRLHEPARLVQVHWVLGHTLLHLGEFTASREHLSQGIVLSTTQKHHASALQHPGVMCLSYAGWTLWPLGYPTQARASAQQGISLAQTLSHPFSLSAALVISATSHTLCRDWHATQEHAEAAMILANDLGFPYFLAWAMILRGRARCEQGQDKEGMAQLQQGVQAWRATGAEGCLSYWLALLAEAYGSAGQTQQGLAVLDDAFGWLDRKAERWCEAELYRLKGELLRKTGCDMPDMEDSPEACFQNAIDVARRQQAKSLELRAATSLARLWQSQGQCQDAYDLLAPVYAWFTEGFDTADLKDARTLLDELA